MANLCESFGPEPIRKAPRTGALPKESAADQRTPKGKRCGPAHSQRKAPRTGALPKESAADQRTPKGKRCGPAHSKRKAPRFTQWYNLEGSEEREAADENGRPVRGALRREAVVKVLREKGKAEGHAVYQT